MAELLTRRPLPPSPRLGVAMALMFVLPGVIEPLLGWAIGSFGSAPPLEATFEASDGAVGGFAAFGAAYAAALMVLMNRARRASPLPPGRKPTRGDITVASVWGMGLAMWLLVTVSGSFFVGRSVNRVVGQVTNEPGRIWIKRVRQGKGCHRQIGIISATVPDGEDLCVPPADWDGLEVDDSVPVVSIISGLGREVGLAPGALSRVTKRTP